MKGRSGKLFVVSTAAAAFLALAAACGGTPAPEWSLPVNNDTFSCAYDPNKFSQMQGEIDKHADTQRGGNLSDKWRREDERIEQLQILARQTANLAKGVTFNVADGLENVFDSYKGVSDQHTAEMKSRFVCDKVEVFNSEGYAVVIGKDRAHPTVAPYDLDLPYSVAYVFKMQPSGMELAGLVPNYGHHMFAQVVKDYPGSGDLLILGSLVNYSLGRHEEIYEENKAMLDATAQALDFKNFNAAGSILNHGAKLTIHKIRQGELERTVLRPFYFGRDVSPQEMRLEEGGKLRLYISVSTESPVGGRYNAKSGTFDLDKLVAVGIEPTLPLFRR